jgi:hypothetical protein
MAAAMLIANDSQPKQERHLLQAILNNNKQLQADRAPGPSSAAIALFVYFVTNCSS